MAKDKKDNAEKNDALDEKLEAVRKKVAHAFGTQEVIIRNLLPQDKGRATMSEPKPFDPSNMSLDMIEKNWARRILLHYPMNTKCTITNYAARQLNDTTTGSNGEIGDGAADSKVYKRKRYVIEKV
jgi:hypothetical protein